jgi:hypothetical protein
MNVGNSKCFFCLATWSLLLAVSIAQAPKRADHNVALARLAESLQARGIGITHDSLIAALHNPDPEIRSLAAMKLAEDHDFGAISEIEAALSNETTTRTRIGMSLALRELDNPKGVEGLESMCNDSSLTAESVIELVQTLHLISVPTSACAGSVFRSLSQPKTADYRAALIALLPSMYHELPAEQANRAVHLLEGFLLDKNQQAAVHLQASHSLAEIGSSSSSAAIRTALSREVDPALRSRYKEDLDTLERSPRLK